MADGGDLVPSAVSLAVCLGWRIAELYDRKELPGPPRHRESGQLPDHLPGFGEMSDHEKACALVAHMGADLSSLGRALGLEAMPAADEVAAALQVPGHNRDDVRAVILALYIEIRNLVAGSNVLAALGFGLGRMLADTTLLPTPDDPKTLEERFDQYRLANAFGWLEDLNASLPPHSAAAVRATLKEWQQWVSSCPRSDDTAAGSVRVDAAVIRALRQQGEIWRRLLTGDQRAEELLDRQAYIGAAIRLLASAWHIGRHYLWKWSWSILLAASAVGAGLWAALTYAPGGTSHVTAAVISGAGFLGISWLSIRATLGRALRQAESALWEAEIATAIAEAATTIPKNGKRRNAIVLPAVRSAKPAHRRTAVAVFRQILDACARTKPR